MPGRRVAAGLKEGARMGTTQTASGSKKGKSQTSDVKFRAQLSALAGKWRIHRGKGLALRLKTGQFLNHHLGDPNSRQARGEGVLEKASKQLGVSVSDLSRMRNFAGKFKSIGEFAKKHPKMTTWTEVKKLLADLSPRGGQNGPRAFTGKMLRHSLERLSSKVQRVPKDLPNTEKAAIRKMFEKLSKMVESRL